ncbi:MAG: histidine--tRNA ligase [Haemophilus parainfluenzae]|jgi:histidine--tRNA ligase|nr:MAG: histidine--tRNA ligase [Haemophilus parainfluenzae]
MEQYSLLTGMRDLLPEEAESWLALESTLYAWVKSYGYELIRTPLLEDSKLFLHSAGESSDIVGKEMYRFVDQNGEEVALRPEGTASVLRAVLGNHYLYSGPKRLWYYGPMFRRERPQKGRYRQFHQLGVEALGFAEPESDAELLLMTYDLWKRLDIADALVLELNTLGNSSERNEYRKALVAYFSEVYDQLDEDSKRRLTINPLRILDSKEKSMQPVIEKAPKFNDYLQDGSQYFYDRLKQALHVLGVPFRENPRLVRGLDYYSHTVFEWVTQDLGSQGTICAGGRYNDLIEILGGKATPAVGFALGMERLILLLAEKERLPKPAAIDFYLVSQNRKCLIEALRCATILRERGFSVMLDFSLKKFAAQFKKAASSHAHYALVLGEEEVKASQIVVKDLRTGKGQQRINQKELIDFLAQWMV